jgi:hypothetical protein
MSTAQEKIRAEREWAAVLRWIPVEVGLPDDDETVLIWTADGEPWTGYLDAGQWRYVSSEPISYEAVTHWMPFPEGPS